MKRNRENLKLLYLVFHSAGWLAAVAFCISTRNFVWISLLFCENTERNLCLCVSKLKLKLKKSFFLRIENIFFFSCCCRRRLLACFAVVVVVIETNQPNNLLFILVFESHFSKKHSIFFLLLYCCFWCSSWNLVWSTVVVVVLVDQNETHHHRWISLSSDNNNGVGFFFGWPFRKLSVFCCCCWRFTVIIIIIIGIIIHWTQPIIFFRPKKLTFLKSKQVKNQMWIFFSSKKTFESIFFAKDSNRSSIVKIFFSIRPFLLHHSRIKMSDWHLFFVCWPMSKWCFIVIIIMMIDYR